ARSPRFTLRAWSTASSGATASRTAAFSRPAPAPAPMSTSGAVPTWPVSSPSPDSQYGDPDGPRAGYPPLAHRLRDHGGLLRRGPRGGLGTPQPHAHEHRLLPVGPLAAPLDH